jgi:hydroxymethylpyrimidine/phosphomethylpyrimidine kinase
MHAALTIAGSDSSAGAGIQADLKTFAAFGVYGVSALAAVTAQSTIGVTDWVALSARIVRAQIDAVLEDVHVSAVKTGMLATADIVSTVSERLSHHRPAHLVVDPVLIATRGASRTLLAPEAVLILKQQLFPLAAVVTPNRSEAAVISGMTVDSLASGREAARRIADMGPRAVVIKGGHLPDEEAVDLLFHDGSFTELRVRRAAVGEIHGTGCTFASAIAARLALGDDIPTAVQQAKRYITGAIEHSFEIGRGARVLNHFWDRPL